MGVLELDETILALAVGRLHVRDLHRALVATTPATQLAVVLYRKYSELHITQLTVVFVLFLCLLSIVGLTETIRVGTGHRGDVVVLAGVALVDKLSSRRFRGGLVGIHH